MNDTTLPADDVDDLLRELRAEVGANRSAAAKALGWAEGIEHAAYRLEEILLEARDKQREQNRAKRKKKR